MMSRKTQSVNQSDSLRLVALLDGREAGRVYQAATGRLRFSYDDRWRADPDAYPLSLAMPLAAEDHRHEAISAFLWGLLPDNGRTLDQYARLFGVSAGNPVALLSHIGADCPGAVQLAVPDRIDALIATAPKAPTDWLTERDVADELRTVLEQGIPGTTRRTVGQFSLAGAQPKIALLEEAGRWGRPSGRTPTNRILKPPSGDFPGFAENEHFCLAVLEELGLGAVRSRVLRFADEVAIVVDRFDRLKRNRSYIRIHQEDACQALAVMPNGKYENEGGPGIAAIVALLRENSRNPGEDIARFVGATVVNWLLAATDAHAKNYALLHGPGGGVRLAPFYDVASYLPYGEPTLHRAKLAMKIGREYLVRRIVRADWNALAKAAELPAAEVNAIVDDVVSRMAGVLDVVRTSAVAEGLEESVITKLANRITAHVKLCRRAIN